LKFLLFPRASCHSRALLVIPARFLSFPRASCHSREGGNPVLPFATVFQKSVRCLNHPEDESTTLYYWLDSRLRGNDGVLFCCCNYFFRVLPWFPWLLMDLIFMARI
jgi:hypothetical protein